MDQPLINRIVEGALLASSQPLTLAQLQGLFPEEEPAPPGSIERALEILRDGCADRGVELVEVASGFRFQVTNEVHGYITRLWTERKTRYTRATLETLALIAYRQPITRGEIEQVRGVAVSSNIIQALEEREWIRVVGHRDVPGKPALFGTTKGFLDYFGLKRLDELPPLSELRDLGELEPQLPLDSDGQPAGKIVAGVANDDGDGDTAANDAEDDADGIDDAGTLDVEPGSARLDTPTQPASRVEPGSARLDAPTQPASRVKPGSARLDAPTQPASRAEPGSTSDEPTDPDSRAEPGSTAEHTGDTRRMNRLDRFSARLAQSDEDTDNTHDPESNAPPSLPDGDDEPDTAPGTRAAHPNETENNAVATTTVAVDEADPEPEADETSPAGAK